MPKNLLSFKGKGKDLFFKPVIARAKPVAIH